MAEPRRERSSAANRSRNGTEALSRSKAAASTHTPAPAKTRAREAVLPASPLVQCLDDEVVADVDEDVLHGRSIAVRVRELEGEVEIGIDCPTGLLDEPDVHDLQHVVIGRVPSRQGAGGTAAAIGPGNPVQVDGAPVSPFADCMIWMPWIW